MQTYTHLLMGIASAPYLSDKLWFQAVWVAGNLFPDGTVATQYLLDRIAGKPPLVVEPKAWVRIKNICHSLVSALIILMIGIYSSHYSKEITIFAFGMIVHILIDIITHSKEDSNCVYAYPFPLQSYCLWEYRIGDGILRPKLPELVICLIFTALIIINIIW